MRKIAEFLGLSPSADLMSSVLFNSSFDHMQQNDKLNYSWYINKKDAFIRKGKVGGWKDFLNPEQEAYFEEPIRKVEAAGGKVRCEI